MEASPSELQEAPVNVSLGPRLADPARTSSRKLSDESMFCCSVGFSFAALPTRPPQREKQQNARSQRGAARRADQAAPVSDYASQWQAPFSPLIGKFQIPARLRRPL